jgi:prephenate dehydrogenase
MTTSEAGGGRSPGSLGDAHVEPLPGPVLVVGAGLIGASVAMALSRAGVQTYIRDVDPAVAHVASSRGAGSDADIAGAPALVVVATPPDDLGPEVERALTEFPTAVVTDVGSVKAKPLAHLERHGVDRGRYVGGHPMAGSERSGPLASAADLFEGRTWAVVERPDCDRAAVRRVVQLAHVCGAVVVRMTTQEHDDAVARVSHLPHVVAALTAGRLVEAPDGHLALSGQGLRDVTRVAAGDPGLWRQIVTANADAVGPLLLQLRTEIDQLIDSLETGDGQGVERVLRAGAAGVSAIPGKHGGPSVALATVTVTIPDEPGALARLFADAADAEVNIEDLRIDHDPARASGLVEIDVAEDRAEWLTTQLRNRNWATHR